MSVEQRMHICRLIEKMEQQSAYCKKLGLEDVSVFYDTKRNQEKEKSRR